MIDHVTYMMRLEHLESTELPYFFSILDMEEIRPDRDTLEHGWRVRWFRPKHGYNHPVIHIVAGPRTPELELAHFCVTYDEHDKDAAETFMRICRESKWLERDSGSGRIWLKGPGGIRAEVRARSPMGNAVAAFK